MKIIFSHPTGNSNVRAAIEGMAQAGVLQRFYTTVAVLPGYILEKISHIKIFSELQRRSYPTAIAPHTRTYPWYELGRIIAPKIKRHSLLRHETGIFSIDNVYQTLDKRVARYLRQEQSYGGDTIYSYEDGAASSFIVGKSLNMQCLYDLPIGYWRAMHRMLEAARESEPEWANTLTGFNDSKAKLDRKEQELALADHIFVASSFTASTLKEYPGELASVSVIPYGFPSPAIQRTYRPAYQRPLKLLFVGGLSQRKGLAQLFEAVEYFGKRVELTIVGSKVIGSCPVLDNHLNKHNWIPSLPHADILKLMQQQDIFIFPSLFEGFGLVITEAMSQGTPVITTERTAGPDIIQQEENGWVTEAGNVDQLKETIQKILSSPEQIERVGKAAIETARQRPWNTYGTELIQAILKMKIS